MANAIVKYYQQTLMGERTRQREAKFVKLSGESYRYWYWSADAGPLVDEPIHEQKTIQLSPDTFACPACQMTGSAESASMGCPYCGSPDIQVIPGETAETTVITGTRKVPAGDVVFEVVDPLEVKLDMHSRSIDESPYLLRKRMILKETMKAKFPWFALSGQGGFSEAMTFQSQLEVSPGNTASATSGAQYTMTHGSGHNRVEFAQLWLDPVYYDEYIFPVDTMVGPKGEAMMIPKGTVAKEMFESGMYLAKGGAGVLLDVRPEDKKKHWAQVVDDLIPGNVHGDGIDDVIEIQDKLNDKASLQFEWEMRNSCPPTYYDQRMFKGEQFDNQPGSTYPVQNLMPGMKIGDGVFVPEYGQLSPLVVESQIQDLKDMVEMLGAQSLNGTAPELENGTATAAKLNHDQSQGLSAVPLALKAEADVATFTGVMRLVQENWDGPRFLPLLGSHGKIQGKWFEFSDVLQDFVIQATPGSWVPRNPTEKRNDFAGAMAISPALPLGPYTPGLPRFVSHQISEVFSLDTDVDTQDAMAERAFVLLSRVIKMAEQAEESGIIQQDPTGGQQLAMMILQKVPINPLVDDIQIHTDGIKEFFCTDEGIDASEFTVAVLNLRLQELQQMGMAQQMQQAQQQMMLQPPQEGPPNGKPPSGPPQQ